MSKNIIVINRPKVYKQITGLRSAGKTEHEIAKILGLTPATVRYVVSINLPSGPLADDDRGASEDHRLKLAYEMRQSGNSFAEISQKLQVNRQRVRRMVHRYGWILRHSE
jgi:predicted transcriptional regulator